MIPSTADIRAGLFDILRESVAVQSWASAHGFDLTGSQLREWEPFAKFVDFGVLLGVDPVSLLTPEESCKGGFYNVRFTLYVQYSGGSSALGHEWLTVLENVLDGAQIHCDGMSGSKICVKDVEFDSRGRGTRRDPGWELPSMFTCKAGVG